MSTDRPLGESRRSYLVCSVQRSGTWLLCHALEDTGVMGVPAEYFHRGDEAFWRERWGVAGGDEAFLQAVRREPATANGVWASKMMWNYFPDALVRLRGWLPSDAPDPDVLGAAFPGLRYVWLRRNDTLRQGISWWRAAATGQFALVDGQRAAKPPGFDRQAIDNLRRLAEASHRGWRDWFAVHAINPLELVYEDLVGDLDGAVDRVAHFLGVARPPGRAAPRLHRQADEHTERFVWLYENDAGTEQEPVVPAHITGVGGYPASVAVPVLMGWVRRRADAGRSGRPGVTRRLPCASGPSFRPWKESARSWHTVRLRPVPERLRTATAGRGRYRLRDQLHRMRTPRRTRFERHFSGEGPFPRDDCQERLA